MDLPKAMNNKNSKGLSPQQILKTIQNLTKKSGGSKVANMILYNNPDVQNLTSKNIKNSKQAILEFYKIVASTPESKLQSKKYKDDSARARLDLSVMRNDFKTKKNENDYRKRQLKIIARDEKAINAERPIKKLAKDNLLMEYKLLKQGENKQNYLKAKRDLEKLQPKNSFADKTEKARGTLKEIFQETNMIGKLWQMGENITKEFVNKEEKDTRTKTEKEIDRYEKEMTVNKLKRQMLNYELGIIEKEKSSFSKMFEGIKQGSEEFSSEEMFMNMFTPLYKSINKLTKTLKGTTVNMDKVSSSTDEMKNNMSDLNKENVKKNKLSQDDLDYINKEGQYKDKSKDEGISANLSGFNSMVNELGGLYDDSINKIDKELKAIHKDDKKTIAKTDKKKEKSNNIFFKLINGTKESIVNKLDNLTKKDSNSGGDKPSEKYSMSQNVAMGAMAGLLFGSDIDPKKMKTDPIGAMLSGIGGKSPDVYNKEGKFDPNYGEWASTGIKDSLKIGLVGGMIGGQQGMLYGALIGAGMTVIKFLIKWLEPYFNHFMDWLKAQKGWIDPVIVGVKQVTQAVSDVVEIGTSVFATVTQSVANATGNVVSVASGGGLNKFSFAPQSVYEGRQWSSETLDYYGNPNSTDLEDIFKSGDIESENYATSQIRDAEYNITNELKRINDREKDNGSLLTDASDKKKFTEILDNLHKKLINMEKNSPDVFTRELADSSGQSNKSAIDLLQHIKNN